MRKILAFLMMSSLTAVLFLFQPLTLAQQVTTTPLRVIIASSTPETVISIDSTPTPTLTTTPEGLAQLQAKVEAGEINVRAEPDTDGQRLGTIVAGQLYVVRARFFSWYQFDYPSSPTGTAWVYGELVDVTGDVNAIPERDPSIVPTSALEAAQEATLAIALETPGGDATATASARIIVIPTSEQEVQTSVIIPGSLATYTPPAEYNLRVVATVSADNSQGLLLNAISSVSAQGVPPGMPIAGLAVIGILGLAVGILRR